MSFFRKQEEGKGKARNFPTIRLWTHHPRWLWCCYWRVHCEYSCLGAAQETARVSAAVKPRQSFRIKCKSGFVSTKELFFLCVCRAHCDLLVLLQCQCHIWCFVSPGRALPDKPSSVGSTGSVECFCVPLLTSGPAYLEELCPVICVFTLGSPSYLLVSLRPCMLHFYRGKTFVLLFKNLENTKRMLKIPCFFRECQNNGLGCFRPQISPS